MTDSPTRTGRATWQPIETAPKDGTRVLGRRLQRVERFTSVVHYEEHKTFWGKTSHVPLYGWNWGRDPEDQRMWEPTHWRLIDA